MSNKINTLESKTALKTQSNSFELSSPSANVHTQNLQEGFALWMLNPSLWLPTTVGGFVRFFVVIAVLVLGSSVNIYISAQISESQLEQAKLEAEYLAIQRQNAQITWQIAEYTSLDQIRQRAVNIGYIGAPRRSYAVSPISDDTLATLDATIFLEENLSESNARKTAQRAIDGRLAGLPSIDGRLAGLPELEGTSEGAQADVPQQGQDAILAANISANRLVENGLLEAIKVIDGR